MKHSPASSSGQPATFSELLNHLFATHVSPRGRPYSLRDVHDGTGGKLSIAYLSLLRRGRNVGLPSADKVQALAEFFGVDISYFLPVTSGAQERRSLDPDLEEALANPQVRDIALRASALGETERQFFMKMLEQAYQLRVHFKALEQASQVRLPLGVQQDQAAADGGSGVEGAES